ncbi:MAG: hypothetical protein QM775_03785 [Pirellulales bacterium]
MAGLESFIPFIFVGFIALFGVLAYWGYKQNQKRLAALREWAAAQGFSFVETEDWDTENRFADFDCFKQGSRRYGYNFLQGRYRDFPATAFEYHYETYSKDKDGKQETHHHYFSAVILETGLPLKPLWIRPEGFFDRIGEFLGFDDIDFESAEFSRKFHVSAQDRRWAFDVLHQQAMEYLLTAPRLTLEMQHGRIMARGDGCFDAVGYEGAMETATKLIEMLPNSVRRELRDTTQQ